MRGVNTFVQSERQPFSVAVRSFLPPSVVVPFSYSRERDYACMVRAGDRVVEGQVVAVSRLPMGADIHSPVPGIVEKVVQCPLPNGCMGKALSIKLGGAFSYLGKKPVYADWSSFSGDALLAIFKKKGVVNTFHGHKPLAETISRCKAGRDRFLVVRLFDEDPSRMTDSFIASQCTSELVVGVHIVARALNASGILFAVGKKSDVSLPPELFSDPSVMMVQCDTARYPAGFRQNLVAQIKKQCVSGKDSPFSAIGNASVFIDPETALSAYEAVVTGVPVVERYVHVTGSCLNAAAMFKVRIGTTIESLVQQCGGLKKRPAKIIINGMITGSAVSSLETPVTRHVKSVAFVPAGELNDQRLAPCVRCGKCRAICPEGLFPDLMFRQRADGMALGEDFVRTASLCSDCCLCNSVCPSRLPLCQTIALLRNG